MKKERFINLVSYLNEYLTDSSNQEKIELFIERAKNENAWFSDLLIRNAMKAIKDQFLVASQWEEFFNYYGDPIHDNVQKVGLILPGNLPAVGMHDLLMTIASGHQPIVKLSSQDRSLMTMYIDVINTFELDIQIEIQDRMSGVDAVIATGSDFSSGYFVNYFAKIPHLIRKNRSSVAVLSGKESFEDFKNLAADIFMYYGLGCRNVSTIAVPESMDLVPLFDVLTLEDWVLDHTKYSNNYQYHKTLYLLNQIPHFDLGNLIVTENDALVSPVGVLHVHRYSNKEVLNDWLVANNEKIQCTIGTNFIPFGQAQNPSLDDFADGVNTYQFLTSLS
jgi:hypothetical protein